jgi:hypothetical protein
LTRGRILRFFVESEGRRWLNGDVWIKGRGDGAVVGVGEDDLLRVGGVEWGLFGGGVGDADAHQGPGTLFIGAARRTEAEWIAAE